MNTVNQHLDKNQKIINQFIKEYSLKFSSNTLRSYKYSLEDFFMFCKKEFDNVKAREIREWISFLTDKGNKETTIYVRIKAIKVFYRFCIEDNYIQVNPSLDIPNPKLYDKLPFYLEKEQLVSLKELIKSDPMDRALIETMYATGVRVSEVANIKIEDVNFESRIIYIHRGKGKKDRIVPFTIECGERIKEYLSNRTDENPSLFLNKWNRTIKPCIIRNYFMVYSKKLGIKITPHVMRHTMAAHLAMKGMPLYCIQDLLGHDNINNTKKYARLYSHVRKLEYDKYL